jgi:hypothetical protein
MFTMIENVAASADAHKPDSARTSPALRVILFELRTVIFRDRGLTRESTGRS